MRTSIGLIIVALFVPESAWADFPPILTASGVKALKLPDVRVEAAVHHEGLKSNDGARVAHLDVHGVIGGSIRSSLSWLLFLSVLCVLTHLPSCGLSGHLPGTLQSPCSNL